MPIPSKFFVVRVKYLKDGTIKKSELMEYATKQEAVAKFHSNLGADMVDETLQGSMCTVLNSEGGQIEVAFWQLEEEPTPAPTEG